ncbi:hypothetical protein FOL47_006822 [Perkinsus chesapeaki]|uniref:Major facilitator super domain-containing protein 3 n=1 Tax=Perkinsus chesapeaki TaxID=330153 RepID=A0A7J6MWN2_PERCH|nr:hypothetical protein FOL47_006822 [Perkinsus chesapeaki]
MIAIGILLREDLGLADDNVSLALFYANTFIPFYFRCLYGFISDNVALYGTRRVVYMVMCYSIMSALYILYGAWVISLSRAYVVATLINVAFAFAESCLDAVAVQRSQPSGRALVSTDNNTRSAADIQSGGMLCRTLGTLVVGLLASTTGAFLPHRVIIALTSLFPVISVLVVLARVGDIESEDSLVRGLAEFPDVVGILRPLVRPCCFVIFFAMMPNTNDVYNSYIYTTFDYNQSVLNLINVCRTVGSLAGTTLYWSVLRDSPLTKVFVASTLVAACAGLTRLCVIWHFNRFVAIPDGIFVAADVLFVAICESLALMPVLVLAGSTASKGRNAEGFMFAALMAFNSLGGYLSAYWSALVLKLVGSPGQNNGYLNLWLAIVVCTLSTLLPLLMLPLLRTSGEVRESLLDVLFAFLRESEAFKTLPAGFKTSTAWQVAITELVGGDSYDSEAHLRWGHQFALRSSGLRVCIVVSTASKGGEHDHITWTSERSKALVHSKTLESLANG